jgi:hypothetical protein
MPERGHDAEDTGSEPRHGDDYGDRTRIIRHGFLAAFRFPVTGARSYS